MLYLSEEFARGIEGADPFASLQAMNGKVYREVKGRKTLQFQLGGKSYFVKLHFGVGWLEIVKNLVLFRMPILSAENEWEAISKLQSLGVATMTIVAYGRKGWNPARRQSFIVTEDLTETISLEDCCREWRNNPPEYLLKLKLIRQIAEISRSLHDGGVCHRDFYLCHFLLPKKSLDRSDNGHLTLSLIDLHRAMVKQNLNKRWLIKDIGSLYYSAMNIGLRQRDLLLFMKLYQNSGLSNCLKDNRKFWKSVQKRALALHKKLGPVN